jgi:hypothetical protein
MVLNEAMRNFKYYIRIYLVLEALPVPNFGIGCSGNIKSLKIHFQEQK